MRRKEVLQMIMVMMKSKYKVAQKNLKNILLNLKRIILMYVHTFFIALLWNYFECAFILQGDDSCQEFVLLNIKDDNNEEKDTLEFVNVNNIDELSKDVCIPSNSINKGKKERNQKRITNKKIVKTKGKLPKQHICDVCGNIYKHKHSLDTHMRRHRNEKPFACEYVCLI